MSLTQTYTYHGPFTVTVANNGSSKSYSGLRKDFVVFNIETKEDTEELADGAELYSNGGRVLTIEITIDEVVAADLDNLETYGNAAAGSVTIQFTEMGAAYDTFTISTPFVAVHVEGLKAKIRIKKGYPAGTTFATMLSIA